MEHAVEPVPEPAPAAPGPAADFPAAAAPAGDRLTAALDRLVERGVLSRDQAGAVLAELGGLRRLFGEIAGYLGASFVVGATLLFLGEQWEPLGRVGRFSILAAMAVILFGGGLAVRRRRDGVGDEVRRRLSSTLMTAAAAAAGFAAYVILEHTPPDYRTTDGRLFVASLTALAAVVAGYLLARTALGQLGMAVAAFTAYGGLLDLLDTGNLLLYGLGTVALGALWAVLAWRRLIAEHRLGLAVAVALGLLGAQLMVIDGSTAEDVLGYVLTALVAGSCFVAYALIRDWVVLAGGVTGATLVVPEILYDVTDGSLGASGVMLVAGVTLLAGSLAGLRIRRGADPTL